MAVQIQVWENDPASGVLITADQPDLLELPFQFSFPVPARNPDANTSSLGFRYWNAAEALRRGARFWGPAVPDQDWFCGANLEVRLDVAVRWNANYDRLALNFYRGRISPGNFVYASASADMLCHEMGHAMLDSIQPQLWHTSTFEVDAFHESFGDVSALLCALQVPSLRNSIVTSAATNIHADSRLSRIAEQFGTALFAVVPEDAESNCLRNAYNNFVYASPSSLMASGPSSIVVARPHSFSRIFTGAMFEILAGMFAANPPTTPDKLRDVTRELRDIMAYAVLNAPIVPQYFASVAAKMVLRAGQLQNPAYQTIFSNVFTNRLILAPVVASQIISSPTAELDTGTVQKVIKKKYAPIIGKLVDSSRYGLDRPLYVELPADPEATIARSATRDGKVIEPAAPLEAAQAYVDNLFEKGLVNYGEFADKYNKGDKDNKDPALWHTTHRLEVIDDQLRLIRIRNHSAHARSHN